MTNDSLLFQQFFKSPSPARFAEIMAMWPYLSDETKITFFIEKTNKKDLRVLTHLMNELCLLAAESSNPFIRYLAVKSYEFKCKWSKNLDPMIQAIIDSDSHHLIRYLPLETTPWGWKPCEKDFEELLDFEHQARLAFVKSGEINGENFAEFIKYFCLNGLSNQRISEIEVYEIVDTYLSADRFIWYYTYEPSDVGNMWAQGHGLKNMWRLISTVPEIVAFLLIEKLPAQDGDYHECIPEELFEIMSSLQLEMLLSRPDVYQREFRRKMFFMICNTPYDISESLLAAVTSNNFELEDPAFSDEFLQILQLPMPRRIQILTSLLQSESCQPVMSVASGNYLLCHNNHIFDLNWLRRDVAIKKKEIHKKITDGIIGRGCVRDLRLYMLAEKIMPWGSKKPGSQYWIDTDGLRFLFYHIKKGTWETFEAFRDAWHTEYREDESKDELLAGLGF